jgi:arabinofuranosyltransferase
VNEARKTATDAAARIGVCAALTTVLVRTAWVSDDAYMTFRTVDNFVQGHGLRWNVAERVQVYTHPLWLMIMTAAYRITHEAYFTSIAVSLALTVVAIWLWLGSVQRTSVATGDTIGDLAGAIPWIAALLLSRAFIDYSTSGLENPLTHLLLVAFLLVHLSGTPDPQRLGVLACLVALNRPDALLIVLPALALAVWDSGSRGILIALAAFAPLVAWELFSIVYYGFPFPNTAYAKLKTGIAERELVSQGALYLIDSVGRDPVTLAVIGVGLATAIRRGLRSGGAVALGMTIYLVYVVWIGGDFMSGRLLSAPLVAAVVILAASRVTASVGASMTATAAVALIGLSAPHTTLADVRGSPPDAMASTGIADERLFYAATNGLVSAARDVAWPNHPAAENGRRLRREGRQVTTYCCNGMLGYFGGPDVYIVDIMGLGDPLLARLPALKSWRIGHFQRLVPDGYLASVESDTNRVRDAKLAAYYDRLRLITRGPIWGRARFVAIMKMNLGAYDALLPTSPE